MFPWTSDDGFAVVDHRAGQPRPGHLGRRRRAGRGPRADVRLRRQPHLERAARGSPAGWPATRRTPASTSSATLTSTSPTWSGRAPPRCSTPSPAPTARTAWAWTTFGEDQVDVDVRHPRTLLELTDVLLGYLERGASAVRLDAIGFLWKESGTDLPAPAADPRGDQAVAGPGRPRRAGRPAADRDQRAARREHLLLRRRHRRGPPRLPVRAAAPGAALVRGRLDRPPQRLGGRRRPGERHGHLVQLPGQPRRHRDAGHRGHPRRRRARGPGRAHPRRTAAGSRWPAGPTAAAPSTSSTSATSTRCAPPDEARDPAVLAAKALAAHSILLAFLGHPRDLLPLAGRARRPTSRAW